MPDKPKPQFVTPREQLDFIYSQTPQIQEATTLLSPFGISNFYYFRIYKDGKYLHLGNNDPYMNFYVHNVHSSPPFVLDMIEGNYTHFIWPSGHSDFLVDASLAHGFSNGISIIRYSKSYYECWTFATKPENTEIIQTYVNEMPRLRHFISFFNSQYASVINQGLSCMGHYANMGFDNNLISQRAKTQCFTLRHDVSLTPREHECLMTLAQGYTRKGIGRKLDISLKTVEFHLNNIKEKLGVSDRNMLVEAYWDVADERCRKCREW